MSKETRKVLSAMLLGISVAVILWITIFQREGVTENPLSYHPFHTLYDFWKDITSSGIKGNFLGNILIFIPVGIFYPMTFGTRDYHAKKNTIRSVMFGFSLSLLIELTQLIFSKGYFEIDDMILNTIGSLIGYCIYCTCTRINK